MQGTQRQVKLLPLHVIDKLNEGVDNMEVYVDDFTYDLPNMICKPIGKSGPSKQIYTEGKILLITTQGQI